MIYNLCLYILRCAFGASCMAVFTSGRANVLLWASCLTRLNLKQGHSGDGGLMVEWLACFLALRSTARVEEKHCRVQETQRNAACKMFSTGNVCSKRQKHATFIQEVLCAAAGLSERLAPKSCSHYRDKDLFLGQFLGHRLRANCTSLASY